METKIASYQEKGIRLQLIEIKPNGIYTGHYQIRKNRKILCNIKWEGTARQKFAALIQQELLQTDIFSKYEEKKKYKIEMGGRFYIEDREITQSEYRLIVYNNIHKIGNPVHVTFADNKRFITLKETTYEEYKKI